MSNPSVEFGGRWWCNQAITRPSHGRNAGSIPAQRSSRFLPSPPTAPAAAPDLALESPVAELQPAGDGHETRPGSGSVPDRRHTALEATARADGSRPVRTAYPGCSRAVRPWGWTQRETNRAPSGGPNGGPVGQSTAVGRLGSGRHPAGGPGPTVTVERGRGGNCIVLAVRARRVSYLAYTNNRSRSRGRQV